MKRPLLIMIFVLVAVIISYGAIRALRPEHFIGVSSPSVYHPPQSPGNNDAKPLLFYTAHVSDILKRLRSAELTEAAVLSTVMTEAGALGVLPNSTISAQQVDQDHIFYI